MPLSPVRPRVEPLLREMLGLALRRHRHRRGATLRDLALESRVSLAYLSEIERGQKEPSSEILSAVCGALDITVLDLVGDAQRGFVAFEAGTVSALVPAVPIALAA